MTASVVTSKFGRCPTLVELPDFDFEKTGARVINGKMKWQAQKIPLYLTQFSIRKSSVWTVTVCRGIPSADLDVATLLLHETSCVMLMGGASA